MFKGARDLVVALALVPLGACDRRARGSGRQDRRSAAAGVDVAPDNSGEMQTAVFSGGCFWGVQAVFQHVKGVRSAVSGYAGGQRARRGVRNRELGHAPATPSL